MYNKTRKIAIHTLKKKKKYKDKKKKIYIIHIYNSLLLINIVLSEKIYFSLKLF
jgi:hypothetical protein